MDRFDSETTLTVSYDDGPPERLCKVRWPSDAEWLEYYSGQAVAVFDAAVVGRFPSDARGAKLFRTIRLDAGQALTDMEADRVIQMLDASDLIAVEYGTAAFRVVLEVFGIKTEHVFRMPSIEQLQARRAAAVKATAGSSVRVVRSLEPSARLYDLLHLRHSGFVDHVPIVHKVAAVESLVDKIMTDPRIYQAHVRQPKHGGSK